MCMDRARHLYYAEVIRQTEAGALYSAQPVRAGNELTYNGFRRRQRTQIKLRSRSSWPPTEKGGTASGGCYNPWAALKRKLRKEPSGQTIGYGDKRGGMF
jgi:hypothetical protein